MSNVSGMSGKVRMALLGLTIALIAIGVLGFISWGSGQIFSPQVLSRKLTRGMTVAEAEQSLAIPPGSLSAILQTNNAEEVVAYLAEPGIGCYLVPQYEVALVFDENNRLDRCLAVMHWRLDEASVPIEVVD